VFYVTDFVQCELTKKELGLTSGEKTEFSRKNAGFYHALFYNVVEIVMTPSKHGTTTSIRIEKVKKAQVDPSLIAHTAGGQHRGLVINKQATSGKCLLWLYLYL